MTATLLTDRDDTQRVSRRAGETGTAHDRERARRLLEATIEYVRSSNFDDPAAADEILDAPPELSAEARRETVEPPPDTPPYLAALYEIPLLTPAEEHHLFRKMNYLKFCADCLRQDLDADAPNPALLDQIETLLNDALKVRNRIVRANLRLVVSIAKGLVDQANSLDDLISDGNVPLIRAAELFDFERGTRFSTYATWAIRNTLYRSTPRGHRHRKRYVTGNDGVFEGVSDERAPARAQERRQQTLRRTVDEMLAELDSRDRAIVKSRFGLGEAEKPRRFREIAAEHNLSTERVRQLLARSLGRLQEAVDEDHVELD